MTEITASGAERRTAGVLPRAIVAGALVALALSGILAAATGAHGHGDVLFSSTASAAVASR